jgi:hypothetical protein
MKKNALFTAFILFSSIVSAQSPANTKAAPAKSTSAAHAPDSSKPKAKSNAAAIGQLFDFKKLTGGTPKDKKTTETAHK